MSIRVLGLAILVLCGAITSVVAQKKSTLAGDFVIGEFIGLDEATREITLKYPGKEGTESFSGILVDGYKLKTPDGIPSDLRLSEIMPGMRIRVFYKSGKEKVSGQEKKINKVSRIDLLGKDEYSRLRNHLNLDPATAFVHAEKDDLPASSPLKIFPAISYNQVHQQLVEWINKWNQKNGDSYGRLELVSELEQADILIVVARGADTSVVTLPVLSPDGSGVQGVWSHATSYVVVKDAGVLKVLWTTVAPVFSNAKAEVSLKTTEAVIAEIEKRMKAKARNSKK